MTLNGPNELKVVLSAISVEDMGTFGRIHCAVPLNTNDETHSVLWSEHEVDGSSGARKIRTGKRCLGVGLAVMPRHALAAPDWFNDVAGMAVNQAARDGLALTAFDPAGLNLATILWMALDRFRIPV